MYADVCISDDAMYLKSRKYGGAEQLVNKDYEDADDMGSGNVTNA